MYQSTGTQHAKQRHSTSLYSPHKVCSLHTSPGLKQTPQTYIILSFFFFFIRKEQLQNFGKIVNQQLHLYKNTFVIFSVCQQSGTADPEHFFHTPNSLFGSWGENMILELVLFWNVFRLYVSVASLAWRLDLSAERCVGVEPYEAPHGTGASGSHQKASGHMAQRSPPPFV